MSVTSARRVFDSPELLGIICDLSKTNTQVRLAQTSRSAFKAAIPRIWRLSSVQHLLMLLAPTVSFKKAPRKRMEVNLPSYSPDIFARFDLYSPSVRDLFIPNDWMKDESTELPFRLSSFETLVRRAQLVPLVPNLSMLLLVREGEFDEEIPVWLSAFASSSLRTLIMSAVDGSSAVISLGLLAQICPELELLSAHLKTTFSSDAPLNASKQTNISHTLYSSIAISHWRCFRALKLLEVPGHFITEASLVTISGLPSLKSLRITDRLGYDNDLPETLRSTQLPDDSFTTLTALHLESYRPDTILAAWDNAPLVRNLSKVHLRCWQSAADDSASGENVMGRLLPLISELSPHVQDMDLEGIPTAEPQTRASLKSWNSITHLPLLRLRLAKDLDLPLMRKNFPVFPRLATLELPDHDLTLDHLVRISQLIPRLCKLRVNFVDPLGEIPSVEHEGTAPLPTIELVRSFKRRLEIPSPDKVARPV
ncbi:hypothetical protein FRC07_005129 [Ceratobasidium sp. 392]|nr:hypothetical protein FRC07_005129 [Ceratobasidium sp. 392]